MKPLFVPSVITFVFALFFSSVLHAQSFGISASAVWISDCNGDNYFNTSGAIGPAGNIFTNSSFGTHTQNSGTFILRGGAVKTFKNFGIANVCGARMHYRVYPQGGSPGSFSIIDLPLSDNCNTTTNQFSSGGACSTGDQLWSRVTDDGITTPYAPVDLTTLAAGNYVLEVYYDVTGSSTSTTQCDETFVLNNAGNNYKATFSIQVPVLLGANPNTCNGSEGSITISGLTAGATYSVSYTDNGNLVGPGNMTANGAGQIIISGLKAGLYSDFELVINGCTTDLNTGVILSNPVFIPKFNKVASFCAGTAAPALPSTSLNGITGTWSPAIIDNQASGSYTFTPNAGQCGIPVTMNVTVTPRVTPTFPFGTSTSFCAGATPPALLTTSSNGITGTWSPSVVDNQHSATYTFTPAGGQCANGTSFTVTVTPNITPTFNFGTSLTICAGNAVPALPNTSGNGITGSWSPAVVDNQTSGTYTFTPNAGQCANQATFTVTVRPNTTPVFAFGTSLSACAGASVPLLPTTSDNGITGSWNPAAVDNQASAVYTFTPDAGQCAPPVTFSVTIAPNITPAFSFGTSLTICGNGNVPALPNTSDNGIAGTWNPASVDNQHSATYTFTPGAGQCATVTTFTVTVNPNITPIFSFGTTQTICAGTAVPSLPATSDNGIAGTWSPSVVDNQHSATYTFTPASGQCATGTSFTVTVNPNITPSFSFGTSLSICNGSTAPALPTTSDNSITGVWSPAVVDNQNSGTYTFTPSGGQCATAVTFSVTIIPKTIPSFNFGTSLSICSGGNVPLLPSSSTNGITGAWSPAVVDNQTSATYTFTPDAGQCATTTSFNVTVHPNIVPSFDFGSSMTICAGSTVPTLPVTSNNGIAGTWSPATVDNQHSGNYTFTPSGGQCAVPASFTVTVNPVITPVFGFGSTLTICAGSTVPVLPTTSSNGISGTWSPSTADNQHSGSYTFTPAAGQCATSASFTITVVPNLTPAFSFGTSLNICDRGAVPALPATSDNGISGVWSPSTIDNQNSGTYTFTPNAGQCAVSASVTVTVHPIVTPSFNFGASMTICSGSVVPSLASTSDNGITGTWSPSAINNQQSGTYTFTPAAGQCAPPVTLTVTVTPTTTPVFDFGKTFTICAGGNVPQLPTTSANGLTGSWSPASISNQKSGVYTFTPDPIPGRCLVSTSLIVTVNQNVTPTFNFGPSLTICSGSTPPNLPGTSANGLAGVWSPSVISNQVSGTYTFTASAGQCATSTFILSVTVNPLPTIGAQSDTTVNDGSIIPAHEFTGTPAGASFNWTNTNTSIGLAGSGTGNVPNFTAINKSGSPVKGIVSVTPTYNGCSGAARSYVITVLPLNKDVFVPNVFTPNGDGKNDILYVYSNYIDKLEMRIFNQWGQMIQFINDSHKGWDGKFNGVPQPVGVYVYTVKAVMTDGRTVQLTGNITLVR